MRHIVALSGGKDSTAMALRLVEVEPRGYEFVCTPTGSESPEMFAHWNRLSELLGQKIVPIMADTLHGLIRKQKALPNWRQRWCTRILKIEPYEAYLQSLGECTSYVGLRVDEQREGADYSPLGNVRQDFPLCRWKWTLHDVRSYLVKRNVTVPTRTDCLECFFQRTGEWYAFWRDYPEQWKQSEALEEFTGHTFRGPNRDSWPAAMKDMRALFEQGKVPNGANGPNQRCLVCRL